MSSIAVANEVVKKVTDSVVDEEELLVLLSTEYIYKHFTPKEKPPIEKRAAEHGVTATVCFLFLSVPWPSSQG